MAIPLNYLIGDRIDRQAEFRADIFFDVRSLMRKRSHGARQLPDSDLRAHLTQPRQMTAELLVPDGQLESERDRFTMNAVRTSHHHLVLVSDRLPLQHLTKRF